MTYKELAEKFIERDNNAVSELNTSISFYGTNESARLQFLEARVKDLCEVVICLLDKLEETENKDD